MKKTIAVSLFIFFIVIVAIVVAGVILKNEKQPVLNQPSDKIALTAEEVAKHNSAADCWTIVSGKVYDVTSLLSTHTAGADTIIPSCGKDGTVAFNTKNKPEPKAHSENANNILQQYFVGDLD